MAARTEGLRFGKKSGEFKIIQVADMHYADGRSTGCLDVFPNQEPTCSDLNTTDFLYRVFRAENPDLVVFTEAKQQIKEKKRGAKVTIEMASMDVDYILVSEDESAHESELCETDEDDSDVDPTFDLVDVTEKALSNLSIKKTKRRITEKGEHEEGDSKSFEAVEKLIKDGKFDKLKIDQCKVYLKQQGLRRTGKKDILLSRIKEHLELKNGDGEKKYPVASFILNCQGDACMGDVVMFEQKVYEMFSIASRSATGPPLGERIVAGRIVHESYGEAKQQHTFTIEVLWSKGEKPLPALHPLLIKGRNLYKLKTMRQKWDNEEERKKILQEKHERGNVARSSRQTRVQEKEMRKTQRENRKREISHGKQSTKPILNCQDVTNQEQPYQNIQRNPPTRPNLEFVLPQTVQMKPNHSFVYPNSGYPVQAIGRNIFVSGPSSHQQVNNGFNKQVPQQETYHRWGPQSQVNCGYSVHGSLHYERNVPPVPRQMCKFNMQGQCRFGQACKFRHE